jgi:serine/threonine protein kinase
MAAPCLDDFTILSCLGDGSSGTVFIVRENDTGGFYALKAMPKRKPCGKELRLDAIMTERDTLLDLRGDDFILQLRACFHDSMNYYLVTVRDAIFEDMNVVSLLLTCILGISPRWRSPHVAIDERFAAKCCSVLHGRVGTYSIYW